MSYPPQSWQPSQTPSHQHSTEVEHRLTVLEERRDSDLTRVNDRMTLHERAILALASGLYIVAQDRFPQIAAAIRGAITSVIP